MPDTKDNRRWWRKKTNQGLVMLAGGVIVKAVSYFQTEPARSALSELGSTMMGVGNAWAGYGLAKRIDKK